MGTKTTVWKGLVALTSGIASALPGAVAWAAGPESFTGLASGVSAGAETCPTGLCPGSDSCICVPLSGSGKASVIGTLTFGTTIVLDTTLAIGNCVEGFGTATLTAKSGHNSLVLDYTGMVCGTGAGEVLNAGYFIDGADSTGKFAGEAGSGNIAGSEDADGNILGNLNGSLVQ